MEHRIDAANKILGRLATEVAVKLRGKQDSRFDTARFRPQRVVVYNTDRIKLTGRKIFQKQYFRHSGYPGGLKAESLQDLKARDSREVVRRAVAGMLPKNRSRKRFLAHLILTKDASTRS